MTTTFNQKPWTIRSLGRRSPDPHLDEYQKRCQGVCDLVHHVIENEDVTGFYLWGARGCGKTTGIRRALENLGVSPVSFRGTSTAEGLFEAALRIGLGSEGRL